MAAPPGAAAEALNSTPASRTLIRTSASPTQSMGFSPTSSLTISPGHGYSAMTSPGWQQAQQFATYQQPQVVMQALGPHGSVVSRSMEVASEVPMPDEAQIHSGVAEEGPLEELRAAVFRLGETQQQHAETLEGLPKTQESLLKNMDYQLRQSLGQDVQVMKEELMAFLNERLATLEAGLTEDLEVRTSKTMFVKEEEASTAAPDAALAARLGELERAHGLLERDYGETAATCMKGLAATKAQLDTLTEEIAGLATEAALERAAAALTIRLDRAERAQEGLAESCAQQLAAAKGQLDELHEQVEHLSQEASLDHHKRVDLDNSHKDSMEQLWKVVNTTKASLELLERSHGDLVQAHAEANEKQTKDLASTKATLDHHAIMNSKLIDLDNSHKDSMEQLWKVVNTTKASLEFLERSHGDLVQAHGEVNEKQTKGLASTKASLEILERSHGDLVQAHREANEKQTKDLASTKASFDRHHATLTARVYNLDKALQDGVRELSQRMEEFLQPHATRLSYFEKAHADHERAQAEAAVKYRQELESTKASLEHHHHLLTTRVHGLEKAHKDTTDKHNEYMASTKERQASLEHHHDLLTTRVHGLEKAHKDTTDKHNEYMASTKASLEHHLYLLTTRVHGLEKAHKDTTDKHNEYMASTKDLTPWLAHHEEIKINLNARCQELEQSFNIRYQDLDERVARRHLELERDMRCTKQAVEASLELLERSHGDLVQAHAEANEKQTKDLASTKASLELLERSHGDLVQAHAEANEKQTKEQTLLLTHHEELKKSVHDRCQELEQNFNIRHQDLDERVRGRHLELDQAVRNRHQALEESLKTQREQENLRLEQKLLEHHDSELLRQRRLSEQKLSDWLQEAARAEELRGLPESMQRRISEVFDRTRLLEDKRRQHEAIMEQAEERMANMMEAEVARRCVLVADLHTRLGREVAVVLRQVELRAEELASRIDLEANARKELASRIEWEDSFAAAARGVVRAG